MPFINNVHPSSWPKAVQKLKLVQTDSMASNGSFYGHIYGSKADSGIVDEHASGMSVGYRKPIKICPSNFVNCIFTFQMAFMNVFYQRVTFVALETVTLKFVLYNSYEYRG